MTGEISKFASGNAVRAKLRRRELVRLRRRSLRHLPERPGRKVSVHAEGGTTEAVWREDDEMMITGRADLIFCGASYNF